jgi:hypothetical protein
MSAINNTLSGFVQLTVGTSQLSTTTLDSIANNSHPVTISFAPRSTVPELQGNMILDSTDTSTNTCTYKGNVYDMADVQICSVMNKGYQYTGDTGQPVAELIITFAPKQNLAGTKVMDGILLCVPIYDSGMPNHNEYLTQLIDPNMPACNYTNNPGTKYTEGTYKQGDNSSLVNCVKSCCDDPNCISYNFNGGKCSLNNMVSASTTAGETDSSGTINRGAPANNTGGNRSAITPTLQTIFYNSNTLQDTSQKSLAYVTTFDTVNGNNQIVSTKTLFIVVFPVGIHMAAAAYQQLILQMRSKDPSITNALRPYYVPLRVRNYESTVKSFNVDSTGNKVPTTTSNKGEISVVQISNCDDQFKNRFEWFTKPPLVLTKTTSTKTFNSEKCPYYKTSQYKCVPFDQLHDLSGNAADPQDAYVIPGNANLQDMLNKKQPSNAASAAALEAEMRTTEDIITYGASAVVGIVLIYVGYRIAMKIKEDA